MRSRIHESGYRLMASLLVGGGHPADFMSVEIDTAETADSWKLPDNTGKALLVPVSGVSDVGAAVFTGMVRPDDFAGRTPESRITRATVLASGVPVVTSVFDPPVPLVDSSYVSVNVKLEIGG